MIFWIIVHRDLSWISMDHRGDLEEKELSINDALARQQAQNVVLHKNLQQVIVLECFKRNCFFDFQIEGLKFVLIQLFYL